jgi:hypothetical protein
VSAERSPTADVPRAPSVYGLGGGRPGEDLPWSQVEDWLRASRSYWISTTRPNGRPQAMPVWGVWMEGAVIFSTHPDSRKGRNLAANPELVVHLESGDEVAILEGRAEPLERGELLERFVDVYEEKYGFRIERGVPAQEIYLLRPRVAFSWRESDFPQSATRWTFD